MVWLARSSLLGSRGWTTTSIPAAGYSSLRGGAAGGPAGAGGWRVVACGSVGVLKADGSAVGAGAPICGFPAVPAGAPPRPDSTVKYATTTQARTMHSHTAGLTRTPDGRHPRRPPSNPASFSPPAGGRLWSIDTSESTSGRATAKAPCTSRARRLAHPSSTSPGVDWRPLLAELDAVASADCQFRPRRDDSTSNQHGCQTTNPGSQALFR